MSRTYFKPLTEDRLDNIVSRILNAVIRGELDLPLPEHVNINLDLLNQLESPIMISTYPDIKIRIGEEKYYYQPIYSTPLTNVIIFKSKDSNKKLLTPDSYPANILLEVLKLLASIKSSIYTSESSSPPLPNPKELERIRYVLMLPVNFLKEDLTEIARSERNNMIIQTYLSTIYSPIIFHYIPNLELATIPVKINYTLHRTFLPEKHRLVGSSSIDRDRLENSLIDTDVLLAPLYYYDNTGLYDNIINKLRSILKPLIMRKLELDEEEFEEQYSNEKFHIKLDEESRINPRKILSSLIMQLISRLSKNFNIKPNMVISRNNIFPIGEHTYVKIIPFETPSNMWRTALLVKAMLDETDPALSIVLGLLLYRGFIERRALKDLADYLTSVD